VTAFTDLMMNTSINSELAPARTGAATRVLRSATILLAGLPDSGKAAFAHALVRRLADRGIKNAVLVGSEEQGTHSLEGAAQSMEAQETEWYELVKRAKEKLRAGKIVIIASGAQRLAMRVDARIFLRPLYEVHVDGSAETRAASDNIGPPGAVTCPYEPSSAPDLRVDTAALSSAAAEALVVENVLAFLSRPAERGPSLGMRILRRLEDSILDAITQSKVHWKTAERRRRDLLARAPSSKAVVNIVRKSSAQLVVIYGGMDAFLGAKGKLDGISPMEFFRVSGLFGRNLTWVRDPYGDNFMQGVSASLNNPQAVAEWTRSYVRSLPHVREVHAIGYSSGCYGALMFGHMCRMQTVWAFSPRTSRIENAAEARAQLKNMLSAHNGVTQYHIWYSYKNKFDRAFAEFLGDCPGVILHPSRAGGSRHALFRYLAENGALRTILPTFVPSETNAGQSPASDNDAASISNRQIGSSLG
jgi:adenylylsulfate kinase-like enzyme